MPVTITFVFGWAKLTLPLTEALKLCLFAFVGAIVGYIWAWKRSNLTFTFGRIIVAALVVAGVAAAMLVSSNLLARYVF